MPYRSKSHYPDNNYLKYEISTLFLSIPIPKITYQNNYVIT